MTLAAQPPRMSRSPKPKPEDWAPARRDVSGPASGPLVSSLRGPGMVRWFSGLCCLADIGGELPLALPAVGAVRDFGDRERDQCPAEGIEAGDVADRVADER